MFNLSYHTYLYLKVDTFIVGYDITSGSNILKSCIFSISEKYKINPSLPNLLKNAIISRSLFKLV